MSLATLKKKTEAKYKNSSVGLPQFSINGTLRNQGYVGQTSLSRFTSRTLYNGIYPRGHGGCCGTFTIGQTVQSGILPLNNPKVIKSSVINNKGMIEEEVKCLNSLRIPNWNKKLPKYTPLNTVKPDNNQHNNSQSDYTVNLAKKTIQNYNTCTSVNQVKKQGTIESRRRTSTKICNYTKDQATLSAITQNEYLQQLSNKCVNNNKYNVNTTKNTPIA
jgi:hypothetical protein